KTDPTTYFTDNSWVLGAVQGVVAVGDIDSDGWSDVLVAGRDESVPLTLFRNNHDTTFATITPSPAIPLINSSIAVGDIDHDGRPDVLVSGNDATGAPRLLLYMNVTERPPLRRIFCPAKPTPAPLRSATSTATAISTSSRAAST